MTRMRNPFRRLIIMSDEEERNCDHVTFKLPAGIQIQASGQIVAMIVTIVVCAAGLVWAHYAHEAQSTTFRQEIKASLHLQNKRTDELICVLALSPEERLEARRGADLSRYCAFLNVHR